MVEPSIAVVVAILAAGAGAAAGFVVRGMRASQRMKQAQEKAALIIEKAYNQQKDLILEAKDEKLRLQREAEDEARAKRTELTALERRLHFQEAPRLLREAGIGALDGGVNLVQ